MHYLDYKVFDITDVRCNHGVHDGMIFCSNKFYSSKLRDSELTGIKVGGLNAILCKHDNKM